MCRFILFVFIALTLQAQTPPVTLDKPPQDVDDALRARIKQFYNYHVARTFRLCEELILEDAKDDFYVLTKPQLDSYKIGNIEYSENFTRAKVIIVGMMPVLLPMAASRVMDQPFASYWIQDKGVWFWYYNKKAALETPFGPKKKPDSEAGGAASLPDAADVTVESLQSALKIDRTRIDLADGKPQVVKVTNTLPGLASLTIDCQTMPMARTGITATFDKRDLKAHETATLTLNVSPKSGAGLYPLRIAVSPTNQILDLTVTVTH
jgi:hypothetical protein